MCCLTSLRVRSPDVSVVDMGLVGATSGVVGCPFTTQLIRRVMNVISEFADFSGFADSPEFSEFTKLSEFANFSEFPEFSSVLTCI